MVKHNERLPKRSLILYVRIQNYQKNLNYKMVKQILYHQNVGVSGELKRKQDIKGSHNIDTCTLGEGSITILKSNIGTLYKKIYIPFYIM